MTEAQPRETSDAAPDAASPDRRWEIWVALFVLLGCVATVAYTFGEVFWG